MVFLIDDATFYQLLVIVALGLVIATDRARIASGLEPVIEELLRLLHGFASPVCEVTHHYFSLHLLAIHNVYGLPCKLL